MRAMPVAFLSMLAFAEGAFAQGARPVPAPIPPLAAQESGGMTCVLEPRLITEAGSPVDGVIEQVLVDRGDHVTAGQVVAKLRSGVEEAEVAVKQAKVEMGKRKVERVDEMVKKQLMSEQEKDEIETEYRVNVAELKRETE